MGDVWRAGPHAPPIPHIFVKFSLLVPPSPYLPKNSRFLIECTGNESPINLAELIAYGGSGTLPAQVVHTRNIKQNTSTGTINGLTTAVFQYDKPPCTAIDIAKERTILMSINLYAVIR